MRNLREAERIIPYEYVRNYYHVPAYIGMRVRVSGRLGTLVKPFRYDQCVYIRFDDAPAARGPYHPTDGIEYLPEGQSA